MMADESCLKPSSTIRYIKYEKYSIRDIVVVIFMAHQASFWVLLATVTRQKVQKLRNREVKTQ